MKTEPANPSFSYYPNSVTHPRPAMPTAINNVVTVGAGNLVQKKLWPALAAMNLDVAVCGLESACQINAIPHHYFQVENGTTLATERLADAGFCGPDTLYYIAVPSRYHVSYTSQAMTAGARVAIEKPLAHTMRAANLLLPQIRNKNVMAVDHFLHKQAVINLLGEVDKRAALLGELSTIEFTCFEIPGWMPGRCQENTIADVDYHGFSLVSAVMKGLGQPLAVKFESVQVATHTPDAAKQYAVAKVPTASRILASVSTFSGREIQLDFRQVKGAPRDEKRLRLLGRNGYFLAEADLSESGSAAHGRLLAELIKPTPKLPLGLLDHITITGWTEKAGNVAIDAGVYEFGNLPGFLERL